MILSDGLETAKDLVSFLIWDYLATSLVLTPFVKVKIATDESNRAYDEPDNRDPANVEEEVEPGSEKQEIN